MSSKELKQLQRELLEINNALSHLEEKSKLGDQYDKYKKVIQNKGPVTKGAISGITVGGAMATSYLMGLSRAYRSSMSELREKMKTTQTSEERQKLKDKMDQLTDEYKYINI